MTAINLEMMKQLIEEFAEKEAFTKEEINVVQQEIKELEQRIVKSQERLEIAIQDRNKVMAMKDRYSGQTNQLSPGTAKSGGKKTSNPTKKSSGSDGSSHTKQDRQSGSESQSTVNYQEPTGETDKPKALEAEEHYRADSNRDQIDVQSDKDDKTIGNINDALRKLFR